MSWWAVEVGTGPDDREAVGAWLVTRTGHAVEERADGTLVSFARDEAEAERLVADLRAAGPRLEARTRRHPLADVDWTTRWREGLAPRRVGRLTITPSWVTAPDSAAGPVIVLDPETAFGSGEHGSTRGALALLDRHLRPGDRVLDLGSGSGILAIAAALLGAGGAAGIELDPEANAVAERNAARNRVADRVAFLDGDAADLLPLLAPADLVLANILRTVNAGLLPGVGRALAPGGRAVFAGMEDVEAPLFRPALEAAGFSILSAASDAGWWAVALERR
jgi:ribosomal protein L11 methyltransferase